MASEEADIVIAGGGGVGLTLALAVKKADPRARVVLVDGRPLGAGASDARASAIAGAARRMLTRLGVWGEIEPEAEAIRDMIVTDSRLGDAVRPVFLSFDGDVEPGEPFAHMVPNGVMTSALEKAAEKAGVVLRAPETVVDFDSTPAGVEVSLGSGGGISAGLLVAADGVRSKLRGLAGIPVVRSDYKQSGIVTTVEHARPHEGRAVEHFLPSGPFAILPLKGGHRSSIVWTEPTLEAERLVGLDDFTFALELERRFGRILGEPKPVGRRAAYPLALVLARRFVAERFALCGDAAHGIHPIAGQGLNMGFRDAAALAEVIVETRRLGLDPGAMDALERYERWRRFDTVQMGVVTDVLNRLFRTDLDPVRFARDVGMGVVDRLPGLKKLFMREAAGISGGLPRLMRGEAI